MSLLPSGVCVTPGNNYFSKNPDQNALVGKAGVQTGSTWGTTSVSGIIATAIPIAGMTPANIAQVTTNPTLVGSTNLSDAQDCWVVAATCGTNQILVYVAGGSGGTNGSPTDNAHYGLAWTIIA